MRILVCAVVMLAGCSIFMRSIERPSAKVRAVSVSAVGLGVTGELSLDVSNPAPVGVPLSGIDWELSIGGARAVTGSVQLSQTIPARGVAPVTTTLTIAARDAVAAGSAIAGGARDYTLVAHLHFATGVGPIDVEVSHAGQLGGGASVVRSVLSSVR
ncbi:MAG: LEA type 2 family protein [Kofleriaceae bacterium]